MNLEATQIPRVDPKKARSYVGVARAAEGDTYETSESGKAAYFDKPKHLGTFGCPVSLLRRLPPSEGNEHFGDSVGVPMWFLKQNRIDW
ncbi:hypothetical protein [Halofilum ochraceum]|uniref:hypothetical protein n=1 Tax=Halofilum ochraceum TaxID=1611323 RepID=UPI0008DA2BCF|nr:hypothetical protein [Halofilum ochraceum]